MHISNFKINNYPPPDIFKDLNFKEDLKKAGCIFLIIVMIFIVFWAFFPKFYESFDLISFVLSITTSLIPIMLVWYNQKRTQWIQSLPNFLCVQYLDPDNDNNTVAEFNYIPLSDLGDARSQAQSLFQSFNDNQRSKIAPILFKFKSEGVKYDTQGNLNEGKPFEAYQAQIKLQEPLHKQEVKKLYDHLEDVECIYWEYPFKKNEIYGKRKEDNEYILLKPKDKSIS